MQSGCAHDDEVKVFQPLALRNGEDRSIDVAINLLIIDGDAHKPVSQVLAPDLQSEPRCIQVNLVIEEDGIESIFLRMVNRTVPPVGACQFGVESAGVFTCLLASMFEVEVHQVLIPPEHLVAERLLTQAVQPLIGHHRVFAYLALTIQFCNRLPAMQVAPPLDDVG